MSFAWVAALRTLAGIGYVAASAGYGARVFLRQTSPAAPRGARASLLFGILCQTAAIGLHCVLTHRTPIAAPADSLSISAWALALLYLALDYALRPAPPALGAVALPAACLLYFAGAVLGHPPPSSPVHLLDSRLVSVHVLTILFAYALLVMASGCAALYGLQDRMLKRKRVGGGLFGKIPPLARLDHLAFSLAAFGFPLLTVGLLTGAVEASAAGMPALRGGDPKVLASCVTWAVYAAYLLLHRFAHWRGPRANALLLGGLAAALVTYLVPTVHRFG